MSTGELRSFADPSTTTREHPNISRTWEYPNIHGQGFSKRFWHHFQSVNPQAKPSWEHHGAVTKFCCSMQHQHLCTYFTPWCPQGWALHPPRGASQLWMPGKAGKGASARLRACPEKHLLCELSKPRRWTGPAGNFLGSNIVFWGYLLNTEYPESFAS